jgi:hypothetical protein
MKKMIQRRAPWALAAVECGAALAPVAFYPDIAAAAVVPVAFNPAGVGMWGFDVGSGNPDVAFAVPAMIAGVPGPTGMLMWRRWDAFDDARRWADADDNLRSGGE